MEPGSGLVVPMTQPGNPAEKAEILWVELDQPEPTKRPRLAPPKVEVPQRPATWPKAWATLPPQVQRIWIREGIEDAQDLASAYTTAEELHGELEEEGIPEEERVAAASCWRSAARMATTARPSVDTPAPTPTPTPAAAAQGPLVKQRRARPVQLNAPVEARAAQPE